MIKKYNSPWRNKKSLKIQIFSENERERERINLAFQYSKNFQVTSFAPLHGHIAY